MHILRRYLTVPALLALLILPCHAQSAQELLNQPPETLAALKTDPHIIKALRFMEVSNAKAAAIQRGASLINILAAAQQRANPNDSAQQLATFRAEAQAEIADEMDDILLLSAQIMTSHFSDTEIEQLTAFYQSGIGKKYLQEQTSMTQEMLEIGAAWGQRLALRIAERMRKKLNETGGRSP